MTFQEVINNIATSISKEKLAITALLLQEAEKIQKFIDEGATAEELLDVNNSVNALIISTNKLEDVLNNKLALITPFWQVN